MGFGENTKSPFVILNCKKEKYMENELIKKVQNKDKVAFKELVEIHKKDLYILAKTKLKREADIEDAIQETLFDVYKHIWCLKDEKCFKKWVTKILINNCNDIIRESKTLFSFYDCNEIEKIEDDNNDYAILEENHDFTRMIDFLSNDDKVIVTLRFVQGFGVNEISKILNMKEGTIRMRLSRIKEKIKDRYDFN